MQEIKDKIRTIQDYPKQGVMFRDITTLLQDANGFRKVVDEFVERYKGSGINCVVGIESRGFILGGAIAHRLGVGFVPVRKKGKLPSKTVFVDYELEYGVDRVEMHVDALNADSKVLLVDDLLATGGTMLASIELVEKLNAKVFECAVIVDLPDLRGRKKLEEKGYSVFSLVEFEGE